MTYVSLNGISAGMFTIFCDGDGCGAAGAPGTTGRTLDLQPQMERLRSRERLDAEAREGAAAARVLDASPGERRVKVVAAIHIAGAGLDLLADAHSRIEIARPDGRREPV